MDLLAQLHASRRSTVEVDRFRFTVRRPTQEEAITLFPVTVNGSLLARFVVGWEGVTAEDIVPQAGTDAALFSPELAAAWLPDRPDLWPPIAEGVMKSYESWREALNDAPKP